jgi:hypothetical protein
MSLTAPERETIISLNDEDETAEIWTAQRPWITKLRKNPSATLLEEGKHDGSVWARFEVPKELVSVRPKRRKGRPGSAAHLHAPVAETAPTEGVFDQGEAA